MFCSSHRKSDESRAFLLTFEKGFLTPRDRPQLWDVYFMSAEILSALLEKFQSCLIRKWFTMRFEGFCRTQSHDWSTPRWTDLLQSFLGHEAINSLDN